jgi:hypothetical protein
LFRARASQRYAECASRLSLYLQPVLASTTTLLDRRCENSQERRPVLTEDVMDEIVSPALDTTEVWNLTDRLGRAVGQIVRTAGNAFVIASTDARLDASLSNADAVQPSLGASA